MAIDLTCERAVAFRDVPKLRWLRRPGGRRFHVATVHRWATAGLRGERLDFLQVGGTRVTTEGALLDFFRRLTARPEADGAGRGEVSIEPQELDRLLEQHRL